MAFDKPNYTQAPNLFFDAYLPKITALSELKVTLIVLRNTLGWHEKEVVMDIPFLIGATGLGRQSVIDGIKLAIERGTVRRRRVGHSFAYEANIRRVQKVDSLTVQISEQNLDSSSEESLYMKETNKGARGEGSDQKPMPPVGSVSRFVSKRPALVYLAEGEKLPKEFLFPDRLIATEEIVAFAADHGYEGDDLRDSIESMRMKRLRDNKKYKNERELALDIQYWITQCAQNRDKRRDYGT